LSTLLLFVTLESTNFIILSLHDALPIFRFFGDTVVLAHGDALCTADVDYQQVRAQVRTEGWQHAFLARTLSERLAFARGPGRHVDRKSTRLNSSHVKISYAVFCLKKKII